MKTIKNFTAKTKITALILAILIIFYLVPVSVFAEGISTDTGGEVSPPETSSATDSYTHHGDVYEVTELREESVKHFRLEDGSYLAASYNDAVHYMGENGEWQDIDNRLLSIGTDYSTSNARIKFAKKITGSGKLFSLEEGNTKLSMSVIGANKGIDGFVTNYYDSEEDSLLQKKMNLENLTSTILYEEVFDGVDIEYVAHSLNVKENIIVKEKKETYSYSFELKLNKLTPEINSDGDVILYDEGGAVKYIIPAPIVYDAGDSVADSDVSYYTLVGSNNKYTLTVTVDAHWMNDELRTFPVTIDPTVTSAGENVYTDTDFVHSQLGYPYLSIVGDYPLHVKLNTLPQIDQSNLILSANISLTYNSSAGRFFPSVSVHEVLTDWDSNTFSAAAYQAGAGAINASVLDYVTGANPKFQYTFDITSLVQEWYAGTKSNYGVAFKRMYTNSSGLGATGDILKPTIRFSRVSLAAETSPTVTISYFNGKGVEGYWSYSSQSAGVGGSVSVNLADGNMALAIPTLSTTDAIMPYTPTLVYNSVFANKAYVYSNADTAFTTSYTANGFKLNIGETVLKKTRTNSSDETEYYYIYADADGTEHYFSPQVKDGVTTYVDEDGLQLELTDNTNRVIITDTNTLWRREFTTVTAPNANVFGAWNLSKIVDNVGNTVLFVYDMSQRPTSVRFIPKNSSEIQILQLDYYGTGKLKMVSNLNSLDAVIFRYSSTYNGTASAVSADYLRRIDYIHGDEDATWYDLNDYANSPSNTENITVDATALYTYNSLGLITEIEDTLSAQSLRYTWNAGKVSSVKHYAGTSLGQTVKYTYGTRYTDVTSSGNDDIIDTSDDIATRYVFDERGRSVSVYSFSVESGEIYGATVGKYETQDNVKNNLKEQTVLKDTSINYLVNGSFEKRENNFFTDWNTSGNVTCVSVSFTNSGVYGAYLRPNFDVENYQASISQTVTLTAGTYTLSFLYDTYNAANTAAKVIVKSVDDNATLHTDEIPIEATSGTTSSTYSTTFELSEAEKVKVIIQALGAEGVAKSASLTVDSVMLEKRIGASRYSSLQYGGFDSTSYGDGTALIPYTNYWTGYNCTPTATTVNALSGSSLMISAVTGERYVKQRVFSRTFSEMEMGNTGEYLIGGYALATSALNSSTGIFRLRVDVTYYQGEDNDDVIKSFYYDFVPDCSGWQFSGGLLNTAYIPEEGDTNIYTYISAIDVICEFSNQTEGYAYFDNISFVGVSDMDNVKYGYDSEGRMVRKSTYFDTEFYIYEGDSRNPARRANDDGEIWDYTYNALGNVVTEKYYTFAWKQGGSVSYPRIEAIAEADALINKTGMYGTTYTYNNYGQVLTVKTAPIDASGAAVSGGKCLEQIFEYNTSSTSKIFGALVRETGVDGAVTHYYHDQNDGKLLAAINPREAYGTAYTYDGMGNLTGATPALYYSYYNYTQITDAESVSYTYDSFNRLSTITTDSTTYSFTYDAFGNTTSVDAGNYELASYEYNQNNGKLKKLTYSNGLIVEYVYNTLENLAEVWYTVTDPEGNVQKTLAYEYEYTAGGKLYSFKDNLSGKTEVYTYDANDRLVEFRSYDNADLEYTNSTDYYYNDQGLLSGEWQYLRYKVGSGYAKNILRYSYTYNSRGSLTQYRIAESASGTINYVYDALDRLSSKSFVSGSFSNEVTYSYKGSGISGTTTRINSYTSTVNSGTALTYTYTYDGAGNITNILYSTGEEIRYVYDKLNQLTREDNGLLGKTYVYTYDLAGNIIKKETFAMTAADTEPTNPTATVNYTYGDSTWGDRLTAYDGTPITYDSVGNPLTYYNGASYTFTWQGRQLTTATKGGVTYSFTYNDDGIRTSKSANGDTTTYYYSGSLLIGESNNTETILYIYDAEGSPLGLRYREHSESEGEWSYIWFEKNLQGDIVAIYSPIGIKLASFSYDAWGNFTQIIHNSNAENIVQKTPFRYRGYYYDSDLGFYVTGTRCYDPAVGRFINADGYVSTGQGLLGNNMYAYCNNNPIRYVDSTGKWGIEALLNPTTLLIAAVVTVSVLIWLAYDAANDKVLSNMMADACEAVAESDKSIAPSRSEDKNETAITPPEKTIYFPIDPNDFNPVGLTPVYHEGSKNGALISWMDPVSNVEVFRWDENTTGKNGSHYHIYSSGHYYAGDKVPEPYASLYFPY